MNFHWINVQNRAIDHCVIISFIKNFKFQISSTKPAPHSVCSLGFPLLLRYPLPVRLLFITQKLHGQDAFGVLWVRAFIAQGYDVHVLCLESSGETFEFPVHSMGKEQGNSQLRCVLNFERMITTLSYDRVFIHMSPIWYTLGCWYWLVRGIPVYVWYTHYTMQLGVRLFGLFGKKFFCATEQSLPQFAGSPKKVVTGHGIDMSQWPRRANRSNDPYRLLVVHRLSRSKRLELIFRALQLLSERYTIDVYGIDAEHDYVAELRGLIEQLRLGHRITFHGSVPMQQLPDIYIRHRLILNMAPQTIDKTMLEAMTCGCYPVTTAANAKAIPLRPAQRDYAGQVGLSIAPLDDSPEAIAACIEKYSHSASSMSAEQMYEIVEQRHSLKGLMEKMDTYIKGGI